MKKGEMLSKAIVIAVNGHNGQFDRGGNAYILHPLKVMHYLKTDDEELQVIAVLHDVIEDSSGENRVTYEDLRNAGISERVIVTVRGLTKVPGQTAEEYEQAVLSNIDAMLVKKEDLRHNSDIRRLKGVSEKDIKRMEKYNRFYLKIVAKLNELENE